MTTQNQIAVSSPSDSKESVVIMLGEPSSVTTTIMSGSFREAAGSFRSESSSQALEAISSSCFSEDKEYGRKFRWTRLTTPMESYMEAMYTMVLDETNHILRFHLDCQDYYERPAAAASA
eukprot:gene6764-7289_t